MSVLFSPPAPGDADPCAVETLTLGDIRITAILDAESRMATAAVFAHCRPPVPAAQLAIRYPREFTGSEWRFRIRCFLVTTPDWLALIDAGAGPAEGHLGGLLGAGGQLMSVLGSIGVEPAQVRHVVLTHAHDDHVGWATLQKGGVYQPTFERATYYLHPADLRLAHSQAASPARYWERTFEPLQRSGKLAAATDALAAGYGLALIDAPGHTPGHRCARLTAGRTDVLFTGDLLHFSFQIGQPAASGPFDETPGGADAIRAELLRPRPGRSLVLASPHLPDAFTRLDCG